VLPNGTDSGVFLPGNPQFVSNLFNPNEGLGDDRLLVQPCEKGGCLSVIAANLSGAEFGHYQWTGFSNPNFVFEDPIMVSPFGDMILITLLDTDKNVVLTAHDTSLQNVLYESILFPNTDTLVAWAECVVEDAVQYMYVATSGPNMLYKIELANGKIVWNYTVFPTMGDVNFIPLQPRAGPPLACVSTELDQNGTALACRNAVTGELLYSQTAEDFQRLANSFGANVYYWVDPPFPLGGLLVFVDGNVVNGTMLYGYDVITNTIPAAWHGQGKFDYYNEIFSLAINGHRGASTSVLIEERRGVSNALFYKNWVSLSVSP